jgi:hypothetical protein
MKTEQEIYKVKIIILGILVTGAMFLFTSCAHKIQFKNSSVVPAATGYVKVKTDKNTNYAIKLEVLALADVERLQSSNVSYVVWMETDQGKTENLGQLNSSSGFMSKQMKATLETVSSYKPTIIYITAEERTNVRYPGDKVVLTTDRF